MKDILKIYANSIGISFFWKLETAYDPTKVQLVFRDIGFYLSFEELEDFSTYCMQSKQADYCDQCPNTYCRSLLLKTPCHQMDFAVSSYELKKIHELIKGTIFKIEMFRWTHLSGLN